MTGTNSSEATRRALLRGFAQGRLTRREVLKRAIAAGLSMPAIAALLAACGGESSQENGTGGGGGQPTATTAPGETPATGETDGASAREILRFAAWQADIETGDPHFAAGDRIMVDLIFDGLLRYQPGNSAEIEPDIAEAIPEPEMVDGKQVWTFTIRKGVMVHPGPQTEAYELTAEDVVYSLQKAADTNRSAYASEYTGMTFEQVDDYTVRVTVDEPISKNLFLPKFTDYAGGFIVPKKPIEAMGDEGFKQHPVGTGMFIFQDYRPQDRVMLVAHDAYFRGAPKLAGVEYRFVPNAATRELALISGDIDAGMGTQEGAWIEKMSAHDNVKVDVTGVTETNMLHFNVTAPPFDDIRVRQAVAHAIDRDAHVAVFGAPAAMPAYSIVPPEQLAGGLTKEEAQARGALIEFDLDRAKQLLDEAGLGDGFSIACVSSEVEFVRRHYEILQAELAKIGIDLQVTVVDHTTYHAQIRQAANPLVFYQAYRPNADVYLTRFFASDSIVVTGAKPDTNFSHYSAVDDLIERARRETDADAQAEIWREATVQIFRDVAAYPVNYLNFVYGRAAGLDWGHEVKSSVTGYPQITELTTITR